MASTAAAQLASSQPATAPAANLAPLSLTEVRRRYPNLFQQYARLCDREKDCIEVMGDSGPPPSPIDPETGLCTTINFNDFAQPLQEGGGCPLRVDSDGNRFCIFLWRLLSACESGGVGGDACRQFGVLSAALDDVLKEEFATPDLTNLRGDVEMGPRFEHLLGWTAAASNHGLYSLLARYDPDLNRSLFKKAADEWKKLFNKIETAFGEVSGVDEKLVSFANWQCGYFQSLLKQAKKEYGDHARYAFNFKKQKRTPKGPSVSAASAGASASAASGAAAAASTNLKENSIPAKNDAADDEPKPWECEGWVPTRGGKQQTPNMIRNALQKYIDQCKADGTMSQTAIVQKMGVNSNSFRRFMDPKTYKDTWSGTQNGTYWAGARLLAEVKYEADKAKKSGGAKRKSGGGPGDGAASSGKKAKAGTFLDNDASAAKKPAAKMSKAEEADFMARVNAVEGVPEGAPVYDTCPQIVAKIKAFLQRDRMTKAGLCRALGDINSNSMGRFLAGKKQDQCGNVTYKAAYVFFEKLRIMEGQKKSAARLKNEREHPTGYSLVKERASKWVYCAALW